MSLTDYDIQQESKRANFRARWGPSQSQAVSDIKPKMVNSVPQSAAKRGFLRKAGAIAGPAFAASMIIGPMATTAGGPGERGMAGVHGAMEMAGFEIATNFAGKGAAKFARSNSGKFALGKHASKVGKWGRISKGNVAVLAVGLAAEGAYEFQKHLADIGSKQRMSGLEWGKGSPGMDTQKAYTMRQQSLQMMNRGSMSARSLLGREAQYLHQ